VSIRFTCPICKTAYTVNDRNAGQKAECKVCGQRLQVPTPAAKTQTVVGVPVEFPGPSAEPVPSRSVTADDLLPPSPAAPTPRRVPVGLIACGIVGGLFLFAGVVVAGVFALRAGTGAAAAVASPWSTKDWEVQDLADHLRRNGMPNLRVETSRHFPDAVWLVWGSGERNLHEDIYPVLGTGGVLVTKMPADWDWSTFRRTLADKEQKRHWGMGRFRFKGEESAVAKIRSLLDK
jgi:hypothetical protein